jgi:hypothetical protein
MYSKLIGHVRIRNEGNPFLFDIFSELSTICEVIFVDDFYDLLNNQECDMLRDFFGITKFTALIPPEDLGFEKYNPDWILALYDDEAPSKRFRYMKDSLCANEFVNSWCCRTLFLWDEVDRYRTDKLWYDQFFPFLYRWIPEIDYKYDDIYPINQPGPQEDSSTPVLCYKYITEGQRVGEYSKYLRRRNSLNYVTQKHYESLLDSKPILKKLVN